MFVLLLLKKFVQKAAERFVRNINNEKTNLETNIKEIEKENITLTAEKNLEQIAINTGYLYLLHEKLKTNKKLDDLAKKELKNILDNRIEEDVVEVEEKVEKVVEEYEGEGGVIEVVEVDDVEVVEDENEDKDENEGDYVEEVEEVEEVEKDDEEVKQIIVEIK